MWKIFRKYSKTPQVTPYLRENFEYQRGDHVMKISGEILGNSHRGVYANSIKRWDPPYENEIVGDDEKREILRAIIEYWESRGREVTVL
jgi:hypothetical protein